MSPKTKNTAILFHVSLLYNLCLRHDTRRPWWSRIEPNLILGALPLSNKDHLRQLTEQEGVRALVTMNEDSELLPNLLCTPVSPTEWQEAQVEQCFGVTADFSPPTVETIQRCVEFVHKHVDMEKNTTYVHCKAGRGRSTVIVIAFLMKYRGVTVDEGYAFIRTKRRHVSLHPKQRAILHEFATSIAAAKTEDEEEGRPKTLATEPSSEPEATPSSS